MEKNIDTFLKYSRRYACLSLHIRNSDWIEIESNEFKHVITEKRKLRRCDTLDLFFMISS